MTLEQMRSGGVLMGVFPSPMPRESVHRGGRSVLWLAWAVRLTAALLILDVFLRGHVAMFRVLDECFFVRLGEGQSVVCLLASVVLFSLASGLERGKRMAWRVTVLLIAGHLLSNEQRWFFQWHNLWNLGLLSFLIWQRRFFVARSDSGSIRTAAIVCPLLLVALIAYGTVRLNAIEEQTAGDHSLTGCLGASAELVLFRHTDAQSALTPRAESLFSTLRINGMVIAIVGLFLILRPVFLRERSSLDERRRAAALLKKYGYDSLDSYALMVDKSYFFTANGEAVVPYALSGNVAVALGNPIGKSGELGSAIEEFTAYCRRQDWEAVFYEATSDLRMWYRRAGLSLFKVSEEAWIDLERFTLKGREFQNLRTACNRAAKLGIEFRLYPAGTVTDPALWRMLKYVSNRWLESKRGQEMTFDMGCFSIDEMGQGDIGVAFDAQGNLLAFATWRVFKGDKGRVLDLMRCLPEARNVMDFVLVEAVSRFKEQGIRDISLGGAPLANADEEHAPSEPEERVTQFLYERLNSIYGYKSLFEFKRKFRPRWESRYVAYRRGVNLPLLGLALLGVHMPDGLRKFLLG